MNVLWLFDRRNDCFFFLVKTEPLVVSANINNQGFITCWALYLLFVYSFLFFFFASLFHTDYTTFIAKLQQSLILFLSNLAGHTLTTISTEKR